MAVKSSPTEHVLANLDSLLPELETIYKDVHSHPELSMQEDADGGRGGGPLASRRLSK